MLIRSIKLKNFRQYKNVEIDFPTNNKRNITVIIGENGYGKTTLVRAFIWCLYRDATGFADRILLNKDVAEILQDGNSADVIVELRLEHKNALYQITTKETYTKSMGQVVVKEKSTTSILRKLREGSYQKLPEEAVKNEIENILKSDLRNYFFYDGEKNRIEDSAKGRNIKNAISLLTGISRIEDLSKYFDPKNKTSVIGVLKEERSVDNDLLSVNVQDEINKEQSNYENAQQQLQDTNDEIGRLTEQYNTKEAILDSNADIREQQNEINELSNTIQIANNSLDDKLAQIIKIINGSKKGATKPLHNILFAKAMNKYNLEKLLSETTFNTKESLSNISEEAINQLIERGYCLCGAKIMSGNDAYEHLMQSKEHMEPHDFGKYIEDFIVTEQANIDSSQYIIDSIRSSLDAYLDTMNSISDNLERINSLKEDIKGKVDIGEVQRDVDSIASQITQCKDSKNYYEGVLHTIEVRIRNLNIELDELSEKNENNKLINLCIKYGERIYKELIKQINKSRETVREELEESVNSIFGEMYHGDRHLEIDADFKVTTTNNGRIIENSTGTETVKNFAFVAGLLDSVKAKLVNKGEFSDDDLDECYPLVLDAPFSNTDTEHIHNICKVLPKHCDQVIIVLISKDYEIAKDSIFDRIGKTYRIIKHSETDDSIEEEL